MKKGTLILTFLIILALIGCGSNIEYTWNLNTKRQDLKLDIEMEVNQSDYKYIEGGKEKLLSIIHEKKPEDLSFEEINKAENDKDLYKFSYAFSSYEDYFQRYKEITSQESKNTFNLVEFSRKTPFKASQTIVLEDDLSKLLDWLGQELVASGAMSKENEEKLINQEKYKYVFDEEEIKVYPLNEYNEERFVDLRNIKTSITAKKNGYVDIIVSFVVLEEKNKDFSKHLSGYLDDRKVDVKYSSDTVKVGKKKALKHKLELNNIDVKEKTSLDMIHSVFGENYINIYSSFEEEEFMFTHKNNQKLNFEIKSDHLFGRNNGDIVEVIVDVEGMELNGEGIQKIPYKESIGDETKSMYFTLSTTYQEVKFLFLAFLFLLLGVFVVIIKKIGLKKCYQTLKKNLYLCLDILIKKIDMHRFKLAFEIEGKIIKGQDFFICIHTIDKVSYRKKYRDMDSILVGLGGLFGSVVLLYFEKNWLIMGIIILLWILFYRVLKVYNKNVLEIKLMSNKVYMFDFEENLLSKTYVKLMEAIDKSNEGFDLEKVINLVGKEVKQYDEG